MHILFTKSQNSSETLIKRFVTKGHRVTNFSILNIKPIIIPDINFKDFTGVIFTSSNAVQNLKNIRNINHLKCFCVGEETAEFAKKIGFLNIQVAGGNYIELRDLIFKSCDKVKEKFIYVRGEFISNDLEGELFLQAELLSLDGSKSFRAHKTGIAEKAKSIGIDVAEEILSKAGDNFIISETKLAHTIHKKSE